MFARASVLSLVLSSIAAGVNGVDIDVNSPDSIKSTAKLLAGNIIAKYDANLKKFEVPGLFGDPYFWWEAGTVWNGMIGYSYLTGDSQYDAQIAQALEFQVGDPKAFMPPNQTKTLGNDDQSCWGLAAMTAAEVGLQKPKDMEWLDLAVAVFETQTMRWDNATCNGGLRWQIFSFNNGYNYKNSWSNGNYFLLAARLAKFTGNTTFAQYADKSFRWATEVGLVSKDFKVYDGTDSSKGCKDINKLQWSATQGIYTEGAALMYNMTGSQNWTEAVQGFVNSSSVFQSNNILIEVACERNGRCDYDQKAYKGVFARTMARAAVAAPVVKDSIDKVLSTSAKAAAKSCTVEGSNINCPFVWTGNSNADTNSTENLGEILNALEVVQGLLYPQAKALKTGGTAGSGNQTGGKNPNATTSGRTSQPTGAAGLVVANILMVGTLAMAAVMFI